LQERINRTRQRVWAQPPKGFLAEASVEGDGTLAGTLGEGKGGLDISSKGAWGYAPLRVSLANPHAVLYTVNRPGNGCRHQGRVAWIDRALGFVPPHAGGVTVRGDTDFTPTTHWDRWAAQGTKFVLGLDAHATVVGWAAARPAGAWPPRARAPKDELWTAPRPKPVNVQEQIVQARGYQNIVRPGEALAEFAYQPGQSVTFSTLPTGRI
jgi:hypothetical protein